MPTISFLSPKGGAGKSTSALLLATELAQRGIGVTLIDCDPEQWLVKWADSADVPPSLTILPHPGEEHITDKIDDAQTKTAFVILDTEGTANLTGAYAVGRSDLVVIPTQPSTLDGESAAKAMRLVRQQEKQLRRDIPFVVLFTRTSAAIQSKLYRDLLAQLNKAKVPVLQTQLLERAAFKSIFHQRCTLAQLDRSTYKLPDAIANAQAFAVEIIKRFKAPVEVAA